MQAYFNVSNGRESNADEKAPDSWSSQSAPANSEEKSVARQDGRLSQRASSLPYAFVITILALTLLGCGNEGDDACYEDAVCLNEGDCIGLPGTRCNLNVQRCAALLCASPSAPCSDDSLCESSLCLGQRCARSRDLVRQDCVEECLALDATSCSPQQLTGACDSFCDSLVNEDLGLRCTDSNYQLDSLSCPSLCRVEFQCDSVSSAINGLAC